MQCVCVYVCLCLCVCHTPFVFVCVFILLFWGGSLLCFFDTLVSVSSRLVLNCHSPGPSIMKIENPKVNERANGIRNDRRMLTSLQRVKTRISGAGLVNSVRRACRAG